jgi:hypothetical protein
MSLVPDNYVRADGTSKLISDLGVYDMASMPGANLELNPEVEKRLKQLLLDAKETKAQFKLEVFFGGGPRRNIDVRGMVCVWTNGGAMHGGGDQNVYLCPTERDGKDGNKVTCLAPIDTRFMTPERAVCATCKTLHHPSQLVGQIQGHTSTQRWSRLLHTLFHRLECNADLRMCVEKESVNRAVAKEFEKDRGGEAYGKVMGKREWITYPLASIVKDTASGSTLEARIKAFLEA